MKLLKQKKRKDNQSIKTNLYSTMRRKRIDLQ